MEFVSFHTHTTYSYADGYGTVKQHVKRVSDLGMRALGISEHGNINSHAALEREANNAGIHPIFGIEAYFGPTGEKETRSKTHLTIFAMNQEGYRNLSRIVTQSYLDAYQWPTVSWESLVKHNAGLVVLSGCADSLLSCTLLGGKFLGPRKQPEMDGTYGISSGDWRVANRRIQRFLDVFGPERFFLEVQRFPGLSRTCALNAAFAELGKRSGVSLIATADVHYPLPKENEMQTTIHAARRGSSVAITDAEWEYDVLLTYPTSDAEIQSDLEATGLSANQAAQAIENTSILAQRCVVELPKAQPLKFHIPGPTDYTPKQFLLKKLREGWDYRVGQRPELDAKRFDYDKRIKHEVKVIAEKGFIDYFLAVADLVAWAKDRGIVVGPARGSAAASVVCYLLRITEIDPLHPAFDKMVFERFIDPTRSDMPDIDLDFDDERRGEVIERAREVYGNENVASVGNHVKYRGKRALDDVCRANALPLRTFQAIKDRIADRTETDERVDDSIQDVLDSYSDQPEIAELLATFPDQLAKAIALEGNQHSMGIHAGGFVIASDPIPEVTAIYTKEKGTGRDREIAQVIPYEKRDAEYLGMLKVDFLSLTTMGMIAKCLGWSAFSLEELYGLFYEARPDEHKQIMDLFRDDDVTGIFQYEGGTTRSLMRRLRPETFDHLAAVGALSRPGPYYGGQAEAYIAVKNGEADWERIHDGGFDTHVAWTYGQIVYQEQIMWILRDLAGFDIAKVLRVRKIIGKKLGEHQFRSLWEDFRNGCAANGVDSGAAERVWGAITTAAGYAFNIAHAYSYALVAWWQGYLKIRTQTEFFAASLAKNGDGKDEIPRRTALLQDAQRHQLQIRQFDLLQCRDNWEPRYCPNALQPGFRQIPGIGPATAEDILTWVDTLPFEHWPESGLTWDQMEDRKSGVKGVGPKTIAKIKAFATEDDPLRINHTETQLSAFREQLVRGDYDATGIPSSDEFVTRATMPQDNDHVAFVGLVANIVYRDEIETIRSRTGDKIEEIKSRLDDADKTKKATVFAYDEFGEVALRVSRWQYPKLANILSQVKTNYHLIVAWGRTFEGRGDSIQVKSLWVFDPD